MPKRIFIIFTYFFTVTLNATPMLTHSFSTQQLNTYYLQEDSVDRYLTELKMFFFLSLIDFFIWLSPCFCLFNRFCYLSFVLISQVFVTCYIWFCYLSFVLISQVFVTCYIWFCWLFSQLLVSLICKCVICSNREKKLEAFFRWYYFIIFPLFY